MRLCAGLLTPHKVLTESLPAHSVALIQGDLRSVDGRGQETSAQQMSHVEGRNKRRERRSVDCRFTVNLALEYQLPLQGQRR